MSDGKFMFLIIFFFNFKFKWNVSNQKKIEGKKEKKMQSAIFCDRQLDGMN